MRKHSIRLVEFIRTLHLILFYFSLRQDGVANLGGKCMNE